MSNYTLIAGPGGAAAVMHGAAQNNRVANQKTQEYVLENQTIHDTTCTCTCYICQDAYRPKHSCSFPLIFTGVVIIGTILICLLLRKIKII